MRRRIPLYREVLLWLIRKRLLRYPLIVDSPLDPMPRYGHGKSPHPQLFVLIDANRRVYQDCLERFGKYATELLRIPRESSRGLPTEPAWRNGYFEGLDIVALYGFLSENRPARYLEIGSGASTKFAKRAIVDHTLETSIISIDPRPRAEIDSLCDTVVRRPLQFVDMSLFDQLEQNDILFIDGSHRAFTNSDVVVVFLDILPRLKSGVFVHFHDVFLPFDYPPDWMDLFYSEQYMLAAYLLGGHRGTEIMLPNAFVSQDPELASIMDPLWQNPKLRDLQQDGGSFWLRVL